MSEAAGMGQESGADMILPLPKSDLNSRNSIHGIQKKVKHTKPQGQLSQIC
jgi:hypothetical protein